jgi:carbon-monoxide dehydrogenase medium subunit
VAPTIMRASEAERYLDGREVGSPAMEDAGRIAAGEASPISDFRASAEYRRELIAVLTGRALESAWRRAQPEPRRKIA